jgi:hypothetical protein
LLIDHLPGDEPPTGLWNGIVNEIAHESPGASRIPAVSKDWRPSFAVATAGLAVGVLLGHLAGGSMGETDLAAAPLPASSPNIATYVQQHTRMAAQDPLVDPISLGAYVTVALRDHERMEGWADSRR